MKTAIVAMVLSTAVVSTANAGQIWRPGDPLTSDNLLSYVFRDRGRAKIFTQADQRREDAARPVVIESPQRIKTTCTTVRDQNFTGTTCTTR